MAILGFLSSIRKLAADLDTRWTVVRAGYLDTLNTNWTAARAGYIDTMYGRIDKAMSTRLRAPICTVYSTAGATGTYTARHANSYIEYILVGGGGGGCKYSNGSGGGGGGGETVFGRTRLMGSTSVSYTVGTGGAGGTGAGAGSSGGATNILGYIFAAGGEKGYDYIANNQGGYGGGYVHFFSGDETSLENSRLATVKTGSVCGGAGGRGVTGQYNGLPAGYGDSQMWGLKGGPLPVSGAGLYDNGAYLGGGGGSLFGKGGDGASVGGSNGGSGYGAGGGATKTTGNGGAGSGGLIILYDYGNIDDGN